ncbi:alginate lyase-domain-containing protein [Mycena haematopus]|nr:alginate lyase-domain-containing protein [Mycena haematopus]
MPFSLHVLFSLLALASPIVGWRFFPVHVLFLPTALGDPVDWVRPEYVLKSPSSQTTSAQYAIIRRASSTAKNGPWTVTNSKGNVPPSGNLRDYLSWAPYHWPECNWCKSSTSSTGKVHLVHNGTDSSGSTTSTPNDGDDSDDNDWSDDEDDDNSQDESADNTSEFPVNRRMSLRRRTTDTTEPSLSVAAVALRAVQAPLGSTLPSVPASALHLATSHTTTATAVAGTSAPPQAAVKTTSKTSSCTPSPTKTMPPSATWTTCPYVVKDGQVNPDVRTLNDPGAINDAAQSIFFNAIACAQPDSSSSSASCKNAIRFIDAFFLDSSTGMNPHMEFGQVVRGPGPEGRDGTFTGVVDLRGFVKIVNGICIINASDINSQYWTPAIDQAMLKWTTDYANWLVTSVLGKSAGSKANNHGSFYASQLVAAKLLTEDFAGAATQLQEFFAKKFWAQVAASGEQPFEAARTRPYHYRAFNLEALIAKCCLQTNAKLGEQIGLNFWTVKSKYGATIQTALDYAMKQDPKHEDVTEIFPHVAAVAAAYGDPSGKYAAFLKKMDSQYENKPYWYYDQPDAFPQGSRAQKSRREDPGARDISLANPVPFECPCFELPTGACEAINGTEAVVLDDGVYATCDELEPFYTDVRPGSDSV